jgi:hypothetical protein
MATATDPDSRLYLCVTDGDGTVLVRHTINVGAIGRLLRLVGGRRSHGGIRAMMDLSASYGEIVVNEVRAALLRRGDHSEERNSRKP